MHHHAQNDQAAITNIFFCLVFALQALLHEGSMQHSDKNGFMWFQG